MSKDYDHVIISFGGTSINPTVTYDGSGTLVVNRVTGTGGTGGAGYTQYKTMIYVYANVKASETFSIKSGATAGASAMIGAYK